MDLERIHLCGLYAAGRVESKTVFLAQLRIEMKINKITIFLLLASWTLHASAQESVPAALGKDLDQYRSQRLQEKLFVHTDKESYLAGEICWFKLYLVDAGGHHPLDLSKVAYLEWLDKDDKPVLQTKVGLGNGHGDGSVYLPLALHSGNYKLRAYTSWMKNSGADWFFEKTITVVNARKSAEIPLTVIPLQYSVTFFPEGGNLVEDITSKIAFRITDQYGRGVECTGVLTEGDQDTVARLRDTPERLHDTVARLHPYRFGIGSFGLTPRPGRRYRSLFRLVDGTAITTLLPSAYKEGMVMTVSTEAKDRLRVTIQSTEKAAVIYLIAHTRESVKLAAAATLSEGKASFLVDKNSLGDGISHLTIFNAAKQPVCERLVFKSPTHRLHIAVTTDKESYAARTKINLQVSPAGGDDQPLRADCSLSVFRLDSLQSAPETHIGTYLWLASDLKGRIESPDYYFDHPEDEQAMDNLMISHGWRKFRWEDVLQHATPSFESPPEYNGAIISGRIINGRTGEAATDNGQAYLSVPGTRTQFSTAKGDDSGRVQFELKDFYGSREIIVQTAPADSLFKVEITNPFPEAHTDLPLPPFVLPIGYSEALADKSVAMQVLNRYAGEKLKQFHFPALDTSTFYYKPDYTYLLDNYTRFTTMEEVMREYVKFLLVKKRGDHFHLPLLDIPNEHFFENDPLILLDGVPIPDIDTLMTLDPLKIRKLETVQRKFFLGSTSFDGIMNWVTYKGDLGGYILDPHATVVDYEGLQLQREFYSPSYATEEQAASHLPDFRNVLYWSPDLPANARGNVALSFYSSDLPGKYLVVVEGLAADGSAGSGLATFEVK
jgi:hypothetical protein